MNRKSLLLLFVAIGWQSGVFAQTNPLIRYLPEDVTTVIQFDVKRLGSKIPPETFRQSIIYRQMMKDPGMPFGSLLSEPEKLGIDLSAGIILAMKYQGKDRYDRDQPIVHLFIKLKDAEVFTKNIDKLFRDEDQEDKELYKVYGTDRIMTSEGSTMAGWNNDVFVMTTGYGQEFTEEIQKYYGFGDTTIVYTDSSAVVALPDTTARPPFDYEGMMERFKKSQRDLCFQLLTPKSSGGLMSNIHFTNAMNSEADIKLWSLGGSNPVSETLIPFSRLLEKAETLSGKNSTALINFENGKIVMHGRNYPEGFVADIYKKYPPATQNMELVKRLPPGTLLGVGNISFNEQMAGELLQKSGIIQLLDSLKSKIPFDLSLIPGVFKSNIMVAVVKSDITTTTDETVSKMDGLQLVIALPIADKAKFEKLKPIAKATWDSLNATNDQEEFERKGPKNIFAKHNDDLLVLSLSPQTATDFLNNTGTGAVPAILQEYSKYPMVISVNLREILTNMGNDNPERRNRGMNEALLQRFDQVLFYGGQYENGTVNSVFEFRFSNPTENSFKQLFEMLTSIAEDQEARMMEDEESMMVDTAVAMDTAMIFLPIPTPSFKDPELQQYADEYAAYMDEFLATYFGELKDPSKIAILSKKGEALATKSQKMSAKIASDPEEAKKFTDWLVARSSQLSGGMQKITLVDIKQEEEKVVPPPPPPPPKTNPPKVEMKKYTPPAKKKN